MGCVIIIEDDTDAEHRLATEQLASHLAEMSDVSGAIAIPIQVSHGNNREFGKIFSDVGFCFQFREIH